MARRLETTSHVAQIALAVVAIFGYFYTVRPIYQKERLAEQVAEYEGIIKTQKPKIAEIEADLVQLQRERDRLIQDATRLRSDAQREQTRLTNELRNTERQLVATREQKAKIEHQTEFMVYRYRLPDGTPAVSNEQVKAAQSNDLKISFLSSLYSSCALGLSSNRPFAKYSRINPDPKDPSYPFSQEELNTWKEYGAKYPLKVATDCIGAVSANYVQRYPSFSTETESLRKDALDYANRMAALKPWAPPLQPDDLLQGLASGRSAIQAVRAAALKKNEEEYGDWESTLLPDRREIFRHNYQVGKQNAEIKATSDTFSLEWGMRGKADNLRNSVQDEVSRLTDRNRKLDAK